MLQAIFNLDESHINFLKQCKIYGFKDKSEVVRNSLDQLRRGIEEREYNNLLESAILYREIYDEDLELKALTESAIAGWPL